MTATFRTATLADIPRINKLINASYRGETGKQGWTTEAHVLGGIRIDEQRLADIIESHDAVMLVALDQTGEIQGCVELRKKDDTTAYLGMLTVRHDGQARGWGSKILAEAERFVVREWKSQRIEMNVITVRQELIEWYERRGYSDSGERRPFPVGEKFGVPLKGPLEFLVMDKYFR
jgi:ribosomal protein S18 acetylase RimI-like enzyme